MRIMIFGLTLSSSWGNGHATLWRGLLRALAAAGHSATFFERDVPWYAAHRDLHALPGTDLVLYPDWAAVEARVSRDLPAADVVLVSSYCADARAVAALLFEGPQRPRAVFYDLDTPVTLARRAAGEDVDYLPEQGLADFDLVLSFTGGPALERLRTELGARRVAPLYGHVDPDTHRPVSRDPRYDADLSYLGTYAVDRQERLERLFLEPARQRPALRFVLGGSGYPQDFPWTPNIWFVRHLPPPEHPPFFSSSRLTLNITRHDMAALGWCPSGRLFEAAACGTAILSDRWPGLDSFFTPGEEILVADDAHPAIAALDLPAGERERIGRRARARALDSHTSAHRARELITAIEAAGP